MIRSSTQIFLFALLAALPPAAHATPRCEGKLIRGDAQERQVATLAFLRERHFDKLQQRMDGFLDAYMAGKFTDEELTWEFHAFNVWSPQLTPLFKEWIERYPKSHAAHIGMSMHLAATASQIRGEKFASETSRQQFEGFEKRLRQAREWALRSIPLHPKPILAYEQLMWHSRGLRFDVALPPLSSPSPEPSWTAPRHVPRPDVMPILKESVRVQPDNTIVRQAYTGLLPPKWGGSLKALEEYTQPSTHTGLAPDRIAAVMYEATMEIAYDYKRREDLEETVRILSLASQICRINRPFVDIAHIRMKQRRYAEALEASESVLAVVNNSATGMKLKAWSLHYLGRHDEAVAILLRQAPGGSPDIIYLLGDYYAKGTGGLPRDLREARRLFSLSARGGYELAAKRLQEMDGAK